MPSAPISQEPSVSDPGQWQAPAGSPWAAPGQPPVGAPAPQYGEYAPPLAPGQYAPPGPFGTPTGWTPPPKPGLIPLRPLSLGDLVGGSFQVLRRNPRPTFGFALVVSLVVSVLSGGVTALILAFGFSRVASATSTDQDAIIAGTIVLGGIGLLVTIVISVGLSSLVQGIVALEVARGALGEKHTLRGLFTAGRGRFLALIGWTLIASVVATVVATVVIGIVAAVVAVAIAVGNETLGIVLGILLGLLLVLGGIAVSLWLMAKLAFVPTAIVVERLGIIAAVRRSWTLSKGSFWRILGTLLLVYVILSVAQQLVSLPLTFLAPFASILINPNSSPEAGIALAVAVTVLSLALISVMTAVVLVAQSATPALLYIDTRMRREGLDLHLQRFVEDRAAGRPVPENPYLPHAG